VKGLTVCLLALLFTTNAHAVDYLDAKITGIGLVAGEEHVRFTIDKDPNAIFRTNQYSGEQLKRLVALLMSAYTAESPVAFIRSSENSSSSQRHYTDVLILTVGTYTFD
jgi:hypothetical protein